MYGFTTEEKDAHSPTAAINCPQFLLVGGALGRPPPSLLECQQAPFHAGLGTHEFNGLAASEDSASPPTPVLQLVPLQLAVFTEPWVGGVDTDVPFRMEPSTVTYSQHFGQLWVSALTTDSCGEQCLCRPLHG